MKKAIIAVIVAVCLLLTGSVVVCAAVIPPETGIAPMHTSPPTRVYNFQEEDNPYNVNGHTESATMYSAYHFTGASSYLITLTNQQDEDQKIILYRSSDDKKLGQFTIPANETITYIFDCSNVWYMSIYSPWYDFDGVDVEGTIYASAT